MSDPTLRDEAALSWNFLEDEHDPCIVVSERMELVYINGAAQRLVPQEWFGKRCFEVFPVVDETCAFHCPKMDAVSESPETSPKVVYCEETLYTGTLDRVVLGVGLVPLGAERADHARAVFVLRTKDASADARVFESTLLQDAEHVRQRVLSSLPAKD
jgi:hypothetical protein